MKPLVPYSLLAAFAACGMAFGQSATTTPVGYVTKDLLPGQFTLVGLTLHNPTLAAGVIESASATGVTAASVDFDDLLTSGDTYILELPDGTIQEIVTWSGSSLTTGEDISGFITAGTTTFSLRKAATVSDIFGADNSLGLAASDDGELDTADRILIVNPDNSFRTVFFIDAPEEGVVGWFDDQSANADDAVISYPDGFFVQRVGGTEALSLVITGEVKLAPTNGVLLSGFNYLSAVSPVGLTLGDSGIEDFLSQSDDGEGGEVDNVLVQNPDGTYTTAFYVNAPEEGVVGWFDDQSGNADDVIIDSGFLILNRGAAKEVGVNIPSSYASL